MQRNDDEIDEAYYEALSDEFAARTEPLVFSGPLYVGAEAAAQGRAFLIEQFGSEEAVEEFIRSGRPRLGDEPIRRGASPSVRGRVSEEQLAQLRAVMAETGRSQSELVREGIALVLAKHRAA